MILLEFVEASYSSLLHIYIWKYIYISRRLIVNLFILLKKRKIIIKIIAMVRWGLGLFLSLSFFIYDHISCGTVKVMGYSAIRIGFARNTRNIVVKGRRSEFAIQFI